MAVRPVASISMANIGEIKRPRDQGYTLQAIGDMFGVTREWIRQILKKHYGTTMVLGLTSRAQLARIIGCSDMQLYYLEQKGVLNPIRIGFRYLYDRDEAEKAALAVFWKPPHWVTLVCEWCGEVFDRCRSLVAYRTMKRQKRRFH